jgi:hypothetical protein
MEINVTEIKNQLHAGYQFSIDKGGKFAHRSIKVLKQGIEYVRQDAILSGVTFAIANIAFIQVAGRVIGFIAERLPAPAEGSFCDGVKNFVALAFVFSAVAGMNVGFYKALKPSLSPLVATGISIGSLATYILFEHWRSK